MKTAVVILNWNGQHWLEKFLPTVVERSPGALVVVADNASTDGSQAWTTSQCPDVHWIAMDVNRGYAGGYNTALEALALTHPELVYAVLMNSDIEPQADWLRPMEDFMEAHPKAGAIQPKLLDFQDPSRFEYAGGMGGGMDCWGYPFALGRVFDHCEVDSGQYDHPAFPRVFWASGACLMVRLDAFARAGRLDPRLFAHMEEIDLCWRMARAGYHVHAAAPSVVYHVGGGTLGALSPQKTYLNFRNSLLVAVKNLPTLSAMRIVSARLFLDGIAGLLFLSRGQAAHCWAIVRAHVSFYRLFATFALAPSPDPKGWPEAGLLRRSIVWAHHAKKERGIRF